MIDLRKYTSYAFYRLPFADEVHVICQHRHDSEQRQSGRRFVMIPFDEAKHPTIKIYPDVEMTMKMELLSMGNAKAELCFEEDKKAYDEVFCNFKSAIPSEFPKLVLSRFVHGKYIGNPMDVFIRACHAYPRTMVYLCYTTQTGYWIGSTPEILLAGSKSHYRTVALAGTMTHEGEWSEKNKTEQAMVADYVRDIIVPLSTVVEEVGPYTSRAGNLFHLKTEFHFSPISSVNLTTFIERLHPTPAVCGLPKEEAKAFIIQNEGYDRKYYSGVVGMFDEKGETNLYVNLRCCHLMPQAESDHHYHCTLYAGGGILSESTADSEYQETQEKLKTICSVLSPTYSN